MFEVPGQYALGVSNPPPPPPPTVPPPPSGPSDDTSREGSLENGIAVAGLVVSLTGLILSIVIVGGLVGLAGMILSIVGLRRSTALEGRGRTAAIGGIALGLLSIVAATGFTFVALDALRGGADTVRDGVATRSSNDEFPPQEDIVELQCSASESGRLALAVVTLTNNSPETSSYSLTVAWETTSGASVVADARSERVEPGESAELRLFDTSATGIAETCEVTIIDRSSFSFFD